MIKIRTYYLSKVTFYSPEVFLSSCRYHNITIYNFQVLDQYNYQFLILKKDYKKLKNYYLDMKILKIYGFEYLKNIILSNKFTSFLIIISFLLYFFLNTRIYRIAINGTSDKINEIISNRIEELGIKQFNKMPSNSSLKEIEEILKMDLISYVDLISVNSKGTYIFINYEKKGEEIVIEKKNGKMYAKKDGIIKSFDIESGKIVKEINDYVKKGDLLVDDTLTFNDKEIIVGTLGKVFAYTFNKVKVSCSSLGVEKSELYQMLLSKARYELTKNLDPGSYIDKEVIMAFSDVNDIATMIIHYTLVENIVTF